jgi:hypothetical protein
MVRYGIPQFQSLHTPKLMPNAPYTAESSPSPTSLRQPQALAEMEAMVCSGSGDRPPDLVVAAAEFSMIEVSAIPGCATQGDTFEELLQNLYKEIEGCLAEMFSL